jgi:hypothetical protein
LPGLGAAGFTAVAAGLASGKYSSPVLPQADSAQTTSSKLLLISVLKSVRFTARLMFFVPQA